MKLLFIPAKSKTEIDFNDVKLEGKIGVVTTIQYLDSVKKSCKKNFIFAGQILGCNSSNAAKIKNNVDKFLYVGTGKFHSLGLALNTGKDVYILNPLSKRFYKLGKGEVLRHKNKTKGAVLRFLNAKKVGLLITLKLGQYNPGKYLGIEEKLKEAERIKKLYPDKMFYAFVFNTLRKEEIENFNGIDCWVNMACPRLVDDYDCIVNFDEIMNL